MEGASALSFLMKIFVCIPEKFAGCGFYRQYQPHNHLAKKYGVEVVMGKGFIGHDDQFNVDADIIQMHKGWFSIDGIEEAQDRGIPVAMDFDDWWRLDTEHLFYRAYLKDNTTDHLLKLLRTVDYVTCTTDILADEIRKVNKNVVVLPNAMDMNYPGCRVGRYPEDDLVFGYVGGHCHQKDVEMLRGLNNKLSSYSGYKFRLMGFDNSDVYQRYGDVLSDGGRLAGTKFDWLEKADIWHYPQFYNFMDVSLVPLVDNKFNSLKSELKLIEAGFFKRAVIVSNVEPYKRLLRHKENCLVVNKPADWYKNAKFLLDNRNAVTELGEALYETVQPYSIDVVNERRYKFYQDVLTKHNTDSSDRRSRLSVVHG
jgi:glycosyltransferase involved in cell wall biosynthesis